MRSDSRLFVSILLVAVLTGGTALGQSVPSDVISADVSTDGVASTTSVVVSDAQAEGNTVGVTTESLNRYVGSLGTQHSSSAPTKYASFEADGRSFPLPQESQGSATRTTLYIIGGALVVGGAVAGILALGDGGPDPIPAPPSRP